MTTDALSFLLHETYHAPHAAPIDARLRLTLFPGELLRVPRSARRMSILNGRAWLSFSRQDVVLTPGESYTLPRRGRRDRIVQAVGKSVVVVELC